MAKYLKQDCIEGYIDDNAEIEYAQFCNLRHTILGCMMGDFDTQGRYCVAPEIVDELIKMPKYLVDSMDNIEVCASELKLDKQLTFLVTFESDRVTLSLMEKISFEGNIKLNSGTYSNINEYVLDSIETSGVVNKNTIYSMWNIKEQGGTALDVFNMDEQTIAAYFNIVNRFKYLMVANTILLENQQKLEEIESGYANRMLDILKLYPKLKQKVEKELKSTLEEKKDFIKVDKPNFAKTINEIIEKAIENNIDVLNDKEKESFKQEKHQAQMETNILRREVVDLEVKPMVADLSLNDLENPNSFENENEVPSKINTETPLLRTERRETASVEEIVATMGAAINKAENNAKKDPVIAEIKTGPKATEATAKKEKEKVSTEREKLITVIAATVPLETLTTPDKENKKEKPKEVGAEETKKQEPKIEAKKDPAPARAVVKPAPATPAKAPSAEKKKPAAKPAEKFVEKSGPKDEDTKSKGNGNTNNINFWDLMDNSSSSPSDSSSAERGQQEPEVANATKTIQATGKVEISGVVGGLGNSTHAFRNLVSNIEKNTGLSPVETREGLLGTEGKGLTPKNSSENSSGINIKGKVDFEKTESPEEIREM